MPSGKYLAGGLQSGYTASLTGAQYNMRSREIGIIIQENGKKTRRFATIMHIFRFIYTGREIYTAYQLKFPSNQYWGQKTCRSSMDHIKRTAFYSVLHLLVDGVCALAMFGVFLQKEEGYLYILLYNFCAFALQMPLGALLDAVNGGREGSPSRRGKAPEQDYAFLAALAGVVCTVAGALTHPVVLGIGNALFHVGGGIGTIEIDRRARWQGGGLGVFVAPGALGLYLGTLAAGKGLWKAGIWSAVIFLLILCGLEVWGRRRGGKRSESSCLREGTVGKEAEKRQCENSPMKTAVFLPAVCCMAVVILRSYIGMTVAFPWKSGVLQGVLAVLALVCGKAAGGLWAARRGFGRTAAVSLGLAAFCYLFSSGMFMGLAAVFLFNMTMPMTLYGMVCHMPGRPGFAFGFLTFALFLGFLPAYFGLTLPVEGGAVGCVGSLLSLLLLKAGGVETGIAPE